LNKSERRGETVGISAISLWELAMLVARGRIRASMSPEIWLEEMAGSALIETIPITPRIASQSAQLGSGPADPADRIIVATAISLNLTLLASDQRIREWGGVRTI
jgi:PIN domain nuclease of toxin-antitoxin system